MTASSRVALTCLSTPSDANRESASKHRVYKNRKKNQGNPAVSEVYYSDEESEFLRAMDEFKMSTGKRFPTLVEALRVLRSLGWERSLKESPVDHD